MVKQIIYKEDEIPLGDLIEQHEDGAKHLCGICGAELIVALSDEEIKKYKKGKGVFCPNDLKHVNVSIMARRRPGSF